MPGLMNIVQIKSHKLIINKPEQIIIPAILESLVIFGLHWIYINK